MGRGYDITLKDGDVTIRITEVTGCRCMSCEDFTIHYDDADPSDPQHDEYPCYVYGNGSPSTNCYLKAIDLLARKLTELEEQNAALL